jgi:hypothetical protein
MASEGSPLMQTLRAWSRQRWMLWGAFVVAVVTFVAYFPSLHIGFWMDDYIAIDFAGRLAGLDYLIKYFDPRVQRLWYRPMIGMQWKAEYLLFGGEPIGYHVVQVALHLANCWLLYLLVARVTRRSRVGLVAALLYATLPLSSMSVYWTSVHDPLAGVFYLLTILLWLGYVWSGDRLKFVLTCVTFLGALLTKEVSVTLPLLLFLADRLLVSKSARLVELAKRYAIFAIPLAVYAWFEWIVTTRSEFTQQIGYRVGVDTLYVLAKFLSFLAFPWELDERLNYIGLIIASGLLIFFALRRDRRLWFLSAAAVLPTLIAAPIPSHLFNPRYLYLPLMASAVGYGLLFELALKAVQRWRWSMMARIALACLVVLVISIGSATIAERTENFGGFIRQIRMSFRPIYQHYPTFPRDTFLYFLDLPLQTLDISGLMFLRYGAHVTVSGVDRGNWDGLRAHNAAFVWYLDEAEQFKEQVVAPVVQARSTPALPVRFGDTIALDALEVVADRIKRSEAVVVLVRWKTLGWMNQDYTVFAHLVNENGEMVAGNDSQPRKGLSPTTTWRVGSVLVDGIVIPAPQQAGQYRVEIGWYHPKTMERLPLVGADGQLIGDTLVVGPIIVE